MRTNKQTQDLYDNVVEPTSVKDGSLVDFAKKRWDSMAYSSARTAFEERTQNIYWLRDTYEPGLSYLDHFNREIRFPTLTTTITDTLDDLVDVLPETEYVAEDQGFDEDRRKAKLVTKARDDFAEKGNKKGEIYEALRHAMTEGVGILYVGRNKTVSQDGEIEFDGIDYESVNPMSFYFDENATVLHDMKRRKGCRDVFRHYRMSLSTWVLNLEKNKAFYNVKAVKATNTKIKNKFTDREDLEGVQSNIQVDVLEYWNKEIRWVKDGRAMIGIHAIFSLSGNTMIEHFVEESKIIPFSAYYGEKRDDSIYGVPLGEKLAHVIIGLDQQMTIAFRESNLNLMPPTIIRADAGYNRRKHTLRPGGVWQLKVPDGQPIRSVIDTFQRPGLTSDFYNMRNIFQEELVKISKQDPRDLVRTPGQLATQIRARVQSEAKKTNSIIKLNTWNAERHTACLELHVINGHLKFPIELPNGKTKQRIINVKGFDVVNNGNVPELVQNNGSRTSQFILTKDMLECDFGVLVVDKKEKRMLDGEREGRLLQFLQLRTNLLSLPPEAMKKINPLIGAIGEILGLREEEIEPQDEITITSPREKQLELITLGIEPELDEDATVSELLDLRMSWIEYKKTPQYERLSNIVKAGIEKLISDIEGFMLVANQQKKQPEHEQLSSQSQQPGKIPSQPSQELKGATSLPGSNTPSLVPQNV